MTAPTGIAAPGTRAPRPAPRTSTSSRPPAPRWARLPHRAGQAAGHVPRGQRHERDRAGHRGHRRRGTDPAHSIVDQLVIRVSIPARCVPGVRVGIGQADCGAGAGRPAGGRVAAGQTGADGANHKVVTTAFLDAFVDGDTSVFDAVCAALA
jgi:hypothetical protein